MSNRCSKNLDTESEIIKLNSLTGKYLTFYVVYHHIGKVILVFSIIINDHSKGLIKFTKPHTLWAKIA